MPAQDAGREKLKKLLATAQLPALPQSAVRLLELSQDPSNGPAEFAVPIESDPGLTSQVLRFVNSSYFGFSREISSVKLAITLVGVRTIKNFSLWSAVFSLMPNPHCGPFDLKNLWQDSLRRGLFARAFCRTVGLKDPEEPFAAALLQDMAIPLLAKELSKEYTELLEHRDGGRVRLSELEREKFGWTHAEAAVEIAKSWNLPPEFARLIEQHTEADKLADDPKCDPAQFSVALSALLPNTCDEVWIEHARFESLFVKKLPPDKAAVREVLERVDTEFSEFAPILKIAAAARSLVEMFDEEPVAAGG